MEEQLSEILDNLLGLLLLEGSYDIEETEENFSVSIETKDAGRLIGARGESLEALQLLINQMVSRKAGESPSADGFKRVIVDVGGWRKQKEEDLKRQSENWGNQVLETKENLELEPMSAWQRRVVHTAIGEMEGLETESMGEGRDRHIVIKVLASRSEQSGKSKVKSEES
ncbi:KH domain-containing protein [Candidatus Daviesbacteria bacterium]|nr:KH domain-containing protein [Candidatus Daviesbacteria bacterium]